MIGFFNGGPKKVSEREFNRGVMNKLQGLDKREKAEVEMLLRSDLLEDEKLHERGISADEANRAMTWLRDNPKKHSLEDHEVERLGKYLDDALRD